jgi:gamma-glutamyltranspeptidase/glutathione hydrolase
VTINRFPFLSKIIVGDIEDRGLLFGATAFARRLPFFGSQRWAAGFLLNNEMTDFAREVPKDGSRLANAVAPNRRPRSSMSPTMIFDKNGNLLMVTGSPGGNSIPAYVNKTIIGIFDWGLTAQESVDFPNIIARGQIVKVEMLNEKGEAIAKDLKQRG